ncbi:MAG: hypothetical protein JXN64_08355 [Spirochaetes bacterium]|nr:hypothetical protein [Spirochaetota bacterium]
MEINHYIEFQKARDFGTLIGDTFDFIIKNFKPLARSVLIIMIPNFLILFLGLSIFGINIMNIYAGKLDAMPSYFFAIIIIEMFLGIIYMVLLVCVNYDYIKIYMERKGGAISLGDLWPEVKRDFFRVLLNLVGLFFILGLLTVAVIAAVAAAGIFLSEVLAVFLGIFAVLILGTYLFTALWPVFFIIVHEKKRVFSALARSISIVAGKWWFTFGLINVIMIIWMIFVMIASIPYYAVIFLFSFHGIENMNGTIFSAIFVVTYIFLTFFGSIMYMIPLTTGALHYFNLRERKEAPSLFAKVKNLEGQ